MHLLLVDDNQEILDTFSQLLEEEGYTISTSPTGLGALLKAGSERPDVVILDLHLGDVTGFDVFRTLRADPDYETIPILFISGVILDAQTVRLRTGDRFARLLLKPVTGQELVRAIEEEYRRALQKPSVT